MDFVGGLRGGKGTLQCYDDISFPGGMIALDIQRSTLPSTSLPKQETIILLTHEGTHLLKFNYTEDKGLVNTVISCIRTNKICKGTGISIIATDETETHVIPLSGYCIFHFVVIKKEERPL